MSMEIEFQVMSCWHAFSAISSLGPSLLGITDYDTMRQQQSIFIKATIGFLFFKWAFEWSLIKMFMDLIKLEVSGA